LLVGVWGNFLRFIYAFLAIFFARTNLFARKKDFFASKILLWGKRFLQKKSLPNFPQGIFWRQFLAI